MSESFYIRDKKQNEIEKILIDWWNNKVVANAENSLTESLKSFAGYSHVLEVIKERLKPLSEPLYDGYDDTRIGYLGNSGFHWDNISWRDEPRLNSFDKLEKLLKENPDFCIVDEYNKEIPYQEFLDRIKSED